MSFEDWQGEVVTLFTKSDVVRGLVKAAKNGALILIPEVGRRIPMLIEFKDIDYIEAVDILPAQVPATTVENVRQHLFTYHGGVSAQAKSAKYLLMYHESLHKLEHKWGHEHKVS